MPSVRDRKTLREAATALQAEAGVILDSNKVLVKGSPLFGRIDTSDPVGAEEKKTYDRYCDLAKRLLALARR